MFISDDAFLVSSSTALGMSEHLIVLLNTMIKNLPEAELRKVRCALERSVHMADDILYNITISSTFDTLTLSDAFDIPEADVFTTGVTQKINTVATSTAAPPPSPASLTTKDLTFRPAAPGGVGPAVSRQFATTDEVITPAPTYTPAPVPATPPAPTPGPGRPCENGYPLIVSSRPHVGRPNYDFHPAFIKPGIPGLYSRPPVAPSDLDPVSYYVVTKGLYVGIFTSWSECSPWVLKVPGSIYCKVRQWNEAMNLYNGRLIAECCEVLS